MYLGEEFAGCAGNDAVVRRLPTELFGNLVSEGLAALGVVWAHVHVDEGPAMVVGELAA